MFCMHLDLPKRFPFWELSVPIFGGSVARVTCDIVLCFGPLFFGVAWYFVGLIDLQAIEFASCLFNFEKDKQIYTVNSQEFKTPLSFFVVFLLVFLLVFLFLNRKHAFPWHFQASPLA